MADAPPVRFHYIKSNTYRVVHVDGVYGGPTPGKLLYVSFYNERFPIPNVIEHAATDIGGDTVALGEETRREGKDGVVREIDFGSPRLTRLTPHTPGLCFPRSRGGRCLKRTPQCLYMPYV